MWTRLLVAGIGMSCVLALNGCGQETSPYVREVRDAYDSQGKLLVGYSALPDAFLLHMLKDLDACYGDEK